MKQFIITQSMVTGSVLGIFFFGLLLSPKAGVDAHAFIIFFGGVACSCGYGIGLFVCLLNASSVDDYYKEDYGPASIYAVSIAASTSAAFVVSLISLPSAIHNTVPALLASAFILTTGLAVFAGIRYVKKCGLLMGRVFLSLLVQFIVIFTSIFLFGLF